MTWRMSCRIRSRKWLRATPAAVRAASPRLAVNRMVRDCAGRRPCCAQLGQVQLGGLGDACRVPADRAAHLSAPENPGVSVVAPLPAPRAAVGQRGATSFWSACFMETDRYQPVGVLNGVSMPSAGSARPA